MSRTAEEKGLLANLASGILDGMVGDEREYRGYKSVFCGKYIKDGIPVSYRQGQSERFFTARKTSEFLGSVKKSISIPMIKSWHFFRNMAGLLTMMM